MQIVATSVAMATVRRRGGEPYAVRYAPCNFQRLIVDLETPNKSAKSLSVKPASSVFSRC
jgi:hypothetical protein